MRLAGVDAKRNPSDSTANTLVEWPDVGRRLLEALEWQIWRLLVSYILRALSRRLCPRLEAMGNWREGRYW